jgi:hypothetical protein
MRFMKVFERDGGLENGVAAALVSIDCLTPFP